VGTAAMGRIVGSSAHYCRQLLQWARLRSAFGDRYDRLVAPPPRKWPKLAPPPSRLRYQQGLRLRLLGKPRGSHSRGTEKERIAQKHIAQVVARVGLFPEEYVFQQPGNWGGPAVAMPGAGPTVSDRGRAVLRLSGQCSTSRGL